MDSTSNTFSIFIKELKIGNDLYKFFDISKINEEKYCKLIIIIIVNKQINYTKQKNIALLPFSIRVILESAVRNCDEIQITSKDVKNILNWPETHKNNIEIPFLPSRVILQDFTY
jgi:aconitase A